jgi:tRNA(Ile)-lysidine synthase
MHFLRGAGLPGLKGMEYRTLLPVFDPQIAIVRPLLSLWRAETESYCRTHNLEPHFDASNTDQVYFRNRLRHALIPELEKYNPRFKESVLRSAQALQSDYAALLEILEEAWKNTLVETGAGWLAFDQPALAKLSAGLRRNLIRRAAESLRPESRDFGFDVLERAAVFIESPAGRQIDFINGLYLFSEKGKIYLAAYEAVLPFSQWPQVGEQSATSFQLSANREQTLELGNGWVLGVTEQPLEDDTWRLNDDNWSAWLDADRLPSGGLVIRPRRPGDVFYPLGMPGQTIKVQDFYMNVKIPRRARLHWPLVCAGEQVVWVVGYRIANPLRITEKTKRLLHMEI